MDCLVDYPASLDEAEDSHIAWFCHLTNLAKLLGHIIRNLYTSATLNSCSSAVFSQMENSLQSWLDTSPSLLEWSEVLADPCVEQTSSRQSNFSGTSIGGLSSVSGSQSCSMASSVSAAVFSQKLSPSARLLSSGCSLILYHYVRIVMYQPFLYGGVVAPVPLCTPSSSLNQCKNSAAVISEVTRNLILRGSLDRHHFNVIFVSLCSAATIYRLAITSTKKGLPEEAGMA